MRFTVATCIAALTAVASSHSVEFVNQDSTTRTIKFTPDVGKASIADLVLSGNDNKTVSFPQSWIGNWYSISEGSKDIPGMLGEVAWDGFSGAHYFDVSAIVNPNDHSGVKMMYPKSSKLPLSGCETFPCSNAYNLPDDIQTLSTTEDTIVCLVGNAGSASKVTRHRKHARNFIVGHSHASSQ